MILTVFSLCSAEDRLELQQCYGKKETDQVAAVRAIFAKYDVEGVYQHYKESTLEEIRKLIESSDLDSRLTAILRILTRKLFGCEISFVCSNNHKNPHIQQAYSSSSVFLFLLFLLATRPGRPPP